MTIQQYNEYGKFLDDTLRLETYPIAVKFFDNLEDIPKNAIFPKRDMGKHMAFLGMSSRLSKNLTAIG